jgi:CMP-N,N'-diacetyllegionaminic acid synthase
MKVLGIIGIRSGSKGVKDKNIKPLLGKPLVGWVIDAAKKSKYLNRIIVSTDSEKYVDIVKSLGAEAPYLRPSNLATDDSPEIEYIIDTLNWLKENEGYVPDIVVRLMATVPMQESQDIDALIEILENDQNATSSVVIAEARQHPMKALKIIDDKMGSSKLVSYFNESGREVTPIARQSYAKAYFRSNIIASRIETIYETNSLTGDMVRYHIIPQERAIDIDNIIDFSIAELLLDNKKINTK